MKLICELELGWLNGWLPLACFYAVFTILMLIFPKPVVKQLFDQSGWSRKQKILLFSRRILIIPWLVLLVLSPLQLESWIFMLGSVLYVLGFAGAVVGLFDYRHTPQDTLATQGLYRFSRNPQWVALGILMLGLSIATGSWLVVLSFGLGAAPYHLRILAEEQACLAQYGEAYRDYMKKTPRYFLFF